MKNLRPIRFGLGIIPPCFGYHFKFYTPHVGICSPPVASIGVDGVPQVNERISCEWSTFMRSFHFVQTAHSVAVPVLNSLCLCILLCNILQSLYPHIFHEKPDPGCIFRHENRRPPFQVSFRLPKHFVNLFAFSCLQLISYFDPKIKLFLIVIEKVFHCICISVSPVAKRSEEHTS